MFRSVDHGNTNLKNLWDLPSDMFNHVLQNLNLIDMKSLHIALQSQSSLRKRSELNFFTGTLNPFYTLEAHLEKFPGKTAKELFFLIESAQLAAAHALVKRIFDISFAAYDNNKDHDIQPLLIRHKEYQNYLCSQGTKWIDFLDCKQPYGIDDLESAFQDSDQYQLYKELVPEFQFASFLLCFFSSTLDAAPIFSIIFRQYGNKTQLLELLKTEQLDAPAMLALMVEWNKQLNIKITAAASTDLTQLADMIIEKFEILAEIILASINSPANYFIRDLIKTHPQLLQMILPQNYSHSFLAIAIHQQNYTISEFFLENGADPNAMHVMNHDLNDFETMLSPLAIAIENILIDAKNNKPYDNRLVDLLVEHGADPFLDCADYAGDDGKSPYETCKDLIANTNPYYKDLPAELINLLQTFVNQWSAMPRVARDPNYIDPFSNRGHIMRLNAM